MDDIGIIMVKIRGNKLESILKYMKIDTYCQLNCACFFLKRRGGEVNILDMGRTKNIIFSYGRQNVLKPYKKLSHLILRYYDTFLLSDNGSHPNL